MDIASSVGAAQGQNTGAPQKNLYSDLFGAIKVSQSAMRLYEYARMGLVYTIGAQDTALTSLGATATGLTATATPHIAIVNPLGSGVDFVMLKTTLNVTTVGGTAVNPKGFYYVTGSTSVNPISTGVKGAAINLKTLLASGSQAITMVNASTALTGLVGSAVIVGPVGIPPVVNATGPATAIPLPQIQCVEWLEGSLIVRPGQFLGIMCQADTSAHPSNVSAALTWAELPYVN